jgi:hypothetical protein
MNSTYFGLLAEFGAAEIRLDDCCEKYFGMASPQAKRAAMVQSLPVPVYRAAPSQKAGWLVSAADLAALIDRQKADAAKLHLVMQGRRVAG